MKLHGSRNIPWPFALSSCFNTRRYLSLYPTRTFNIRSGSTLSIFHIVISHLSIACDLFSRFFLKASFTTCTDFSMGIVNFHRNISTYVVLILLVILLPCISTKNYLSIDNGEELLTTLFFICNTI